MSKKSGAVKVRSSLEGTEAVDEFMRKLDHPLRPVLEAARKTILGTHSEIGEGIKWNAPSFHFRSTLQPRVFVPKTLYASSFHKGAKVKD